MAIKYKWIAERLKERIKKEQKAGNDRLPTEAELCAYYKVSRQTIRQALLLLEKEGLIEKRQGSGSFITGLDPDEKNNHIKLLMTNDSDYLYPVLISDMVNAFSQAGFTSDLFVTDNRTDLERSYLLSIIEESLSGIARPAGVLVEGSKSALPNPNLDLFRRLEALRIPVLFLHNYYAGLEHVVYVKDNNYQGATALVEHLRDRGHKNIAGFFPSDDLQGLERYSGYAEALRILGLPLNDDLIGWFHRKDLLQLEKERELHFIRKFVREVLGVNEAGDLPRCSALVCYNDEVAYYLIQELERRGVKVPEDFAVVSFDNSYLATAGKTGITSMSHQSHQMGQRATEMMLDLIKGRTVRSRELAWTIRVRESS